MNIFVAVLVSILSIGILLCVLRIISGPTLPERTLASDTVTYQVMGIIILLSITFDTELYFTAILVMALLIFLGTVMVARYMEMMAE